MNSLEKKVRRGLLFGKLNSTADDLKFYVNSLYSDESFAKEDSDVVDSIIEIRKLIRKLTDKIAAR